MNQKFEHRQVALWHPDENGMAYIAPMSGGGSVRKTIERRVNLDLNEQGEVVGFEIFDCPPIADAALIKGENK